MADPKPFPTDIGHYQLIKRLGAGGTASVYQAYDTTTDRHVAIKVLPVHLAANDTIRERFLSEARMGTRLRHPHILPIYDIGVHQGSLYMVMKLVTGGTLDRLIPRGPLPLPFIGRVIAQTAAALDYAHRQGVIHRDLKPANILFDRQGHAYLCDFGIAYSYGSAQAETGSFIGTAAYASPEQCSGEPLTPASDIYALGVVLYEMLTGTPPFVAATPLAVMHKHINEPPPNPLHERPKLPPGLAGVIRKALAKQPAYRYQTARDLSAAFRSASDTLTR
ncbi:MAG: serine/threonine protein kinase [Anaerolineae bacterium]|nr:serine/threonine protein kinase [Anaerolineae bacterium]